MKEYITGVCQNAVKASKEICKASARQKNLAISELITELENNKAGLFEANQQDLTSARARDISEPLLDRLCINEDRFKSILESCKQIMLLPDPVRARSKQVTQPSGLRISKMRVPLGVIGVIYESRPNVTVDVAVLALKAGNAVVLKGGSEAINSNIFLTEVIHKALKKAGLTEMVVQSIATGDRQAVTELLGMKDYIDILIPRGGKGLVSKVQNETQIPIINHLEGICHVYIDESADNDMAVNIAVNAKTRRFGVCNAMETLLVNEQKSYLVERLVTAFIAKNVEVRGCAKIQALSSQIKLASDDDWQKEYLAPIVSIRMVENIEQAIDHINKYGSRHSDAIVTNNLTASEKFLNEVDSSSVLVNASTSFADGHEYGLGAEVGISTNKLHVRGPVGLEGLTTEKYIVIGDGHCR